MPWPRCCTSTTRATEGEWIPNRLGGRENLDAIDFLRQLNDAIGEEHPDVATFAEESTAWPMVTGPTAHGGLGFGYKWDMGWMHDTLQYIRRDPVHRRFHHDEVTFRSVYAFTERYVMPLSHDEVVHGKGSLIGKMPGDDWQRFANLRLLFGMMWAQPGKKLLFMGGELAAWSEWNHDADARLGPPRRPAARRRAAVGRRPQPAVPRRAGAGRRRRRPGRVPVDHRRRRHPQRVRLAAPRPDRRRARRCSPSSTPRPTVHYGYRVGVPAGGRWAELLNSDAEVYGGSGMGNLGGVDAEDHPWHGFERSLPLTIPPLAVVLLRPAD